MEETGFREALFYERTDDDLVKCHLCSHLCRIAEGNRGICGVRENRGGSLFSLAYGKLIARHVDPIEKKPLYHFLPGSYSYSIASAGCNFRCKNCQNWKISQSPKPKGPVIGQKALPERVVESAKNSGCNSIAYTYTEPVVFMEYALDTAKLAAENHLKNIFVTNGYVTEEALNKIAPYLHAANIDLKSFSDRFYREVCGARLDPVLESIKLHKKLGIWIEVTTLVIPGLNDSDEELSQIATFIHSVDSEIPWHVTAFHPHYELINIRPTPVETLREARKIGIEAGLKHIYQGNIPGEGENTYCPHCGELLIERFGYRVSECRIVDSRCPKCGTKTNGLWK